MPTADQVRNAVTDYVQSFVKQDRDLFMNALADDVEQEDPAGSPRNVGKDALGKFWETLWEACESIEFQDRELYVSGSEGALVFTLTQHLKDGTSATYKGVDIFRVDDDGNIAEVKGLAAPA